MGQENCQDHCVQTYSVFVYVISKKNLLYNHRIGWVRRDLKDIQFQPFCHKQGHLPLHQVTQTPVQPGPEHCLLWWWSVSNPQESLLGQFFHNLPISDLTGQVTQQKISRS